MRIWLILFITVVLTASCSAQKGTPIGTNSKKAYALFGEALRATDLLEYDDAISKLNKAIAKDPNYVDAHDLLANTYLKKGDVKSAKVHYQKVLELRPDHPYAIMEMGHIHFVDREYDDCIHLLRRILDKGVRAPKYAEAQYLEANAKFAKKAFNNPVPFEPKNLGPNVNTELEEYFPGLSLDEESLFYTRRDGSLPMHVQDEDLYMASWENSSWVKGKSLGEPINTKENEGAFSASTDGKFLLFTSCARQGGYGSCDIWLSKNLGDQWQDPVNLGKPVNSRAWESQPSLASDGYTLYFTSNRAGGYGGTDLWVTRIENGSWTVPENLGPKINTPKDEQFPFIHPDGKTIYFTSEGLPGMGRSDVFMSRLGVNGWSEPQNLGYPINTKDDEWNFVVNRAGDKAYFASNRLDGGYGGMDIYETPLYHAARPQTAGFVKGIVFDKETGKKLRADVKLYELETGLEVGSTFSDPVTGAFVSTIPSNNNYGFEAKAEGYLFYSDNFSLKASSLKEPFVLEIGLEPIKAGKKVVIKNIFFDVDRWEIKPNSLAEINILKEFLQKNSELKVEIGGHTDNSGSAEHNKELSHNRAKAVYNKLISLGIDASRLSYKGYGSSQPISDNNTAEGRAQNRRTEFKVI